MDISQLRLKWPCEWEEIDKEQQRETREEIGRERVLSFLKRFRERILQFNVFIQLYTPYPTISQIYKNTIRDKIRDLKSFYYDFNKTNPQFVISHFESHDDPISKEVCTIYQTVSDLLDKMNEHINAISAKKVISDSPPLYDWA